MPVTIGELGTVDQVGLATTGYARTDGEPAVTISVTKTSGANTVSVADAVSAELAAAQVRNPDIRVLTVSDLSSFIKESRDGLVREGGLGALFAILTIFLFLFSLRSTLVAAVSIPLSIFAALTLMQLTGISMNIMTLGGLAVAVGRVVDDAIVVLENIYRHRSRGEARLPAVLTGASEVSGAITASTATTVMVFLPLGFVGGLVSQFFLPFALTVTFALLASLLCALTVVPVLAYFLSRPGQGRRRRARRAETLDLGPGLHAHDHLGPSQPAVPVDRRRRCRRAVRRLAGPAPVHPDPVHQLRRREDPVRLDPAASRHQLEWRPRAHDPGRVDPRREPAGRADPVDGSRRRRYQHPVAVRRVPRSRCEQRDAPRQARPEGRHQGVVGADRQ